jgi:hypothetical protein
MLEMVNLVRMVLQNPKEPVYPSWSSFAPRS